MTEFRKPTDAQVKEALRRIPTPQLRRAFFEGLRNPLWLEPLTKEGLFEGPPEPEMTPDGLLRDTYWPEIDYLIRVAPDAPKTVVDILLKLGASNNAWVRRAVFTIGSSIPAAEATRFMPLLKSWLASGFGWRTDPREMVDFAVNLLKDGQSKSGKWVAKVLFRPSPSKTRTKPSLVLGDYWYERGLPRIAEALGESGLQTVLPWLVEYERQREHLTETFDITYLSRETIRTKGGFGGHDSIEQSLIDAVRDLAIKAMYASPEAAILTLVRSGMILGRKIALFAVGEALNAEDVTVEQVGELLTVAGALLSDEQSQDDACWVEYAELARAVAKRSPNLLEPLEGYISAGPKIGLDAVRERLRGDEDETPEDLEARVLELIDGWKHRRLAAVGFDALPAALKPVLRDLNSRFGEIDNPLAPVDRVTSWVGPNSPISQDEMAAMSPAELVAHLASWHDTGDGWGPEPSHEGQGRQLTALMTTNPKILAGVDDLVDRLRPTYLRAILRGWEAAIKAGFELDWSQVYQVLRDVLTHADESHVPVEGGKWDDDANFRGAKQAAVSLLEELVEKRDEPLLNDEHLATFARILLDEGADETAWSEYDSDEQVSGMDALTLSINWQWPIRVRGALNLMAHGKDAPWYGRARLVFEDEIARPDRHGASRAVVGEGLGRLLNVDSEWIEPRVPELFGSADGISRDQQIALTTAMAIHHYHRDLYDLLTPSMLAAIRLSEPLVAGWSHNTDPLQRIGEWVVDAIIFGHKTIDDPVAAAFFSAVEPEVRGNALGQIALSFMHAETVDDPIRDRLAELWDARVEHIRSHPDDRRELSEFYWFVKSGKFDASWWLPRLKEAIELDPNLARERYIVGKEVAAAAEVDPRGAFEVTKGLLMGREEAGMLELEVTRNAVPVVIARAMRAGDEELKQKAVRFMNLLGERGNVGLEKVVNDVLAGAITLDDVSD